MSKDLKISGPSYNTSLAIFFVGYVIFEVPSNVSRAVPFICVDKTYYRSDYVRK